MHKRNLFIKPDFARDVPALVSGLLRTYRTIVQFRFGQLLFFSLLIAFHGLSAPQQEVYVSSDGNDNNPGTEARPFKSFEAARNALRAMPKLGSATIWVRGGLYEPSYTIEFTAEDSRSIPSPLEFRATPGETVRIIGAKQISAADFVQVTDSGILEQLEESARKHIVQVDLKKLGINDFGAIGTPGEQMELIYNDRMMTIARWPNDGFAKIADVEVNQPLVSHDEKGDKVGHIIYSGNRPSRWLKELDHLRLHGYWFWDWADQYESVESIDTLKHLIALRPPFHVYGYKKQQRYYAMNLLSEIDTPSEWMVDNKTGILYFWPPEPLNNNSVVMITLNKAPLLFLNNVSNIVIKDLAFEASRGTGIRIVGGSNNRLQNCTIRNVANDGVSIEFGTSNGVEGCSVSNVGRIGIFLSGGDRNTLVRGMNYVKNNRIHDFGSIQRTYAGAIHLSGVGNIASNNEIYNGPHLAVFFAGNNHMMELNRVHDVCTETSDVGVFYTGRDWTARGNVMRYNFVYNIHSVGQYSSNAIYLDDAASGDTIYSNVFYNCDRAILVGGGRDNVIDNNLIIKCTGSVTIDNRGLNWMSGAVGENGVLRQRLQAVPYDQPIWKRSYPSLANVLADDPGVPKGNVVVRNAIVLSKACNIAAEATKYGNVEDNVTSDQSDDFVDASKLDFRLKESAPILLKIRGFKKMPFEKIGLLH